MNIITSTSISSHNNTNNNNNINENILNNGDNQQDQEIINNSNNNNHTNNSQLNQILENLIINENMNDQPPQIQPSLVNATENNNVNSVNNQPPQQPQQLDNAGSSNSPSSSSNVNSTNVSLPSTSTDEKEKGVWVVEIPNFSTYKESFYTPIFKLCDSNWRLLIFPEGNNSPGNISIFLDYYDIGVNPMFQKEATLTLTLINQFDEGKNVKKTSNHNFSFKGVNWGFISFLNLSILLNANSGYLVADKLKIKVEIQSPKTKDLSDPNEIKPYGKFSYQLTNFSHHFENFYSPTFYVCGSNWRIYIFPNGYSSPNYFSVYLDLLDVKFKPLMVKHLFFAIEIVNQKNPEKNLKKWVDHIYDDKNMNFGFPKFVLLTTLLNQDLGYIVDDTIIINIEFTVMSTNFLEPSLNFEIESSLAKNPDCGSFTFYAKKQPNIDLIFSPTFQIAGCLWQLVSYPLENLTEYFSIYLDLVDIKTKPLLRKHISFAIEIVNQDNPAKNFKKYISNIYSYNSFSWLFQKFMKISTLFKPDGGFCKNGKIHINVELIVIASDFLRPIPFNKAVLLSSTTPNSTTNNNSSASTNNSALSRIDHTRALGENSNGSSGLGEVDCNPFSDSSNSSNSSSDTHQLEEVSGNFHYNIEKFSTLDKNFYSPVFNLYNTDWRFYIFPKGNSAAGFFSLYLDYVDPKTKPKIRQYICFILEVVNKDPKKSEKKYSFHTFCYSSVNWGFKKFLPLESIKKEEGGFLDNDTLTVKVTIYFLSQNILDTNHLLSYSHETSKHIQLYSKHIVAEDENAANEKLKKQKSDEETFYYHTIKLTLDHDFEKSGSFDLIDFTRHFPIKVRKLSTLLELKLQIQMIFGISFERQRIWFWDPAPNKASRVTRCPLLLDDEDIFTQYLNNSSNQQNLEMRFHLEVSNLPNPNEKNLFFDPINSESVFVFFKYYDPYKKQIKFMTTKICQSNTPIAYFIPFLNQKLGCMPNDPLLLFGEDSLNVVYCLDPHRTLKYYEISNGSMIICQRCLSIRENVAFPYLTDYFNFIYNKVAISFKIINYKNINSQTDLIFKMEVLKGMKLKEIIRRVAEVIQTFPQNINLYSLSNSESSRDIKMINPANMGEKSVYDTLLSQQRKIDLILIEVKETILPIHFLSWLDKSKVIPL
ncbi:hypothetical protein CYY_002911 [Polysphondylium violaceum]|uniref:MATH domain-containing protein n=1 Tax=Polysphondylium violaceum TaxID=133409 RepID=A0A8J4V1T3_9MYCE|nr:hypothetical protein CYY_002911 [Polysphondylium violaceum]